MSTRTADSPLPTGPGNSGLRPNWKFLEAHYEWENGGATPALVPWNRQGFEYVKWLQRSLNLVLKLKLAVDGLPGPRTMGAIQALQRGSTSRYVRMGLVGSWTDSALIKKGASPPPAFAPPSAIGIDCNFDTRPYLSCISKASWKDKPIAFAVRYYSGYPPKDLSRGEAEALTKAGIRCVTVWERFAKEANGDARGREHGYKAFVQAIKCGQPTETPIYFAIDYEPSIAERPGVLKYFEGVRAGLEKAQSDPKVNPGGLRYQIGIYGNRISLDLCKKQGIVTWFWQSCSQLTAGGTNQFRWPGVAMHQVACEKPLCHGCGSAKCEAKVDWNESEGHEGGWFVAGVAAPRATTTESESENGSAGPAKPPKPLIMLQKLSLSWESARPVDFRNTRGIYHALFRQPLPSVGNVVVRLEGRLIGIDSKTFVSRPLTPAEVKSIGARDVAAKAFVTSGSGLSSSTAHISRIRPDGTFTTETYLVSDGSTRLISLQIAAGLAKGAKISDRLDLERIDLEGFAARVDAAEQKKLPSQTRLEFLASVRKVFQGGPDDSLGALFDRVLFRSRNVSPLFKAGSAEHTELKKFQTLYADGSFVDISHVLTGIEGSPAQKPDLGQSGFMMADPDLVVTWGGDLGSALAKHAYNFAKAVSRAPDDEAPDVRQELARAASVPDLLGDVDGINLGALYDPAKSLKQNLLAYYGRTSRRRFRVFADNFSKSGTALVQPNTRPPKLTVQARKKIAGHVRAFAAPVVFLTYLNKLSNDESRMVVSILELDSPEMDLVVDYFADFIEQGLKRER